MNTFIVRVVEKTHVFYARVALWFGFTDYAYRLTDQWQSHDEWTPVACGRLYAALAVSKLLVKNHGLYECPSCTWATKKKDEHLVAGSWCQRQQESADDGQDWDAALDAHYAERDALEQI